MTRRLVFAALWFYCAFAVAQTMRDPTRPPPGLGGVQASAAQTPSGGPVLQSIFLSPTRRAAIISGQLVERGAHYGDAQLADVGHDYVVLRNAAGMLQVLKLYPAVEKRPAKGARDAAEPD
ncbi:MAG: MSHA biogenesis protein MshK [Chloroflexi bacterium]|nr:MAG: MSHA biogenesis protein MshK [Chloroflexota bacterium]